MKRLLLSMLASGICVGAMAVPAKPGIIQYTQPDGTVINIMIAGDEHGHMLYSESGLLLMESEGSMVYAEFDADGIPVPSRISVGSVKDDMSLSGKLQPKHLLDGWVEKMMLHKAERIVSLKEIASDKIFTRAETEGQDEDDDRLVPLNFGRCETSFPVLGEQKGLVILVEYDDVPFEFGDFDYFNRMLNEEGFDDFGSLGSARDWFIENSGGLFVPEFDVYGPVKLPNKREYYGGNSGDYGSDLHPEDMAIHACDILDEKVDFSKYDRDGDGIIDNVFIFYAGKGEHDSGIPGAVWPHSWDVAASYPDKEFIYDGVRLNHYACSCEYPSGYKRPDGIGTFVHEFSHVMGLPDLYNTVDMRAVYTPGSWSVMDKGPYNNDGLTPPNYSSYEKCALGWLDFKPFTPGRMELTDLSTTNIAYALPTEKETEFFFFENRQQSGNDKFIPGHGMLVWHVDYKKSTWAANTVNNIALHQYVDLVEADNVRSKDSTAGDAFPGTKNVTSYTYDTKPQLASWGKKHLDFSLEDIEESTGGLISFNALGSDLNAVNKVESAGEEENIYYDLMGRRISNPDKGIYIVNGKKVLVH